MMMMCVRLRNLLRCLLLPMLLAACGGGGSDGDAAPPAAGEPTEPGRLESAAQINRVAVADISAAVQAPDSKTAGLVPRYEVINHRLTYRTIDAQGRPIVASGLVSVPVKSAGAKSPVLSYQHGTIEQDKEAPSNRAGSMGPAEEPAVVLASLGYIVVAADYVGYGASKGTPHPYLLAAPTAAAVIDLLTAATTWRARNGVADNGQLFLIGYSEGGYATMAAHRALQMAGQSAGGALLTALVATAPGAGPYDAGVTLDELLRRVREADPVLGALIDPERLKDASAAVRVAVRELLRKALLPEEADVAFDLTLLDHYLADDRAAIERTSNVHDWAPAVPVRLFHGRDDLTVPYAASTTALAAMRARGAGDVTLADCTTVPSGHLECVPEYLSLSLADFTGRARDL